MDQTAVDPIVDLYDSLSREIDHVRRSESLNLRDVLQLRLFPLLGKIVDTLVERIDLVYDELAAPGAVLSVELVGRIVALLGRYGDVVRAACADGATRPGADLVTALEAEARAVTEELAGLVGESDATPAEAAPVPSEAPAEAAHE